MGVQYHFDVVDGGQVYRNRMRNACFGRLAAHIDRSSRIGTVTLVSDGSQPTIPSSVVSKLHSLQTDEIVYNLYDNWGMGGVDSRTFGSITASFGMSKFIIRQILSDILDIKKELPWLDEVVSVDIKEMTLKARTTFPADQVFTCLSVVRNLVQICYPTYKHFLSQGFSKKNAFLLAQHFRLESGAFGGSNLSLIRENDYMMCHHVHMKTSDVERLFRGEVSWRQGVLRGSRGYFKYFEDTESGAQEINSSDPYREQYPLIPGHSLERVWTSFLNPTITGTDFIMTSNERSLYDNGGLQHVQVNEIFNRWVSLINRG